MTANGVGGAGPSNVGKHDARRKENVDDVELPLVKHDNTAHMEIIQRTPSLTLEKHLLEIRKQSLIPSPQDGKGLKQHCPWDQTRITNTRCDLQLLFQRLVARVPFSYAHFNDGEILAMKKTNGVTGRGLQKLSAELQQVIIQTFHREAPGLVFGIPCQKEFKSLSQFANEQLGNSTVEKTVATLFINSNYKDARSILLTYLKRNPDRNVHMVVSDKADMNTFETKTGIHTASVTKIPANEAFPKGYYDNINNTAHHKPGDLVILCAGPLGRILAVEWFLQRPNTTYLELGSFFDLDFFGKSLGADYYKYNPRKSMCGKTTPVQKDLLLKLIDATATDRFVGHAMDSSTISIIKNNTRNRLENEISNNIPQPVTTRNNWLTIATVCVDEGDHKSPDNQTNTGRDYMSMTMANHAAYAAHHGYEFSPLTSHSDQLLDKDVRYHKLIWVKQLMQNYTWVFFTDCDALFLDFSIDVGRWATDDDASTTELVLTGDHGWAMNSGQFLMRNGTWAKQLLDDAMKEPKHTHGCVGNDNAAFNW
eukprot:CAMPEP_0202029826 /NCGR_PEP_ID=MMETSP0905-20130828/64180_1 /ASSEMBLY_ACC=CAM_ASM_000554 /TAXON_ID=420261 /ORGANISM="Thalassiosira antarctica, Strain CCMP982" /LENGTH=536 /DNA_ID=CAMNT_0048593603 /DNA_START=3 /DNA_END=1610 /DNA_ORIENTATION=+